MTQAEHSDTQENSKRNTKQFELKHILVGSPWFSPTWYSSSSLDSSTASCTLRYLSIIPTDSTTDFSWVITYSSPAKEKNIHLPCYYQFSCTIYRYNTNKNIFFESNFPNVVKIYMYTTISNERLIVKSAYFESFSNISPVRAQKL